MKIIDNGNTSISKVIERKNIDKESFYRLSDFSYIFSVGSKKFIRYTLTNMIIEFSEDEWAVISELKTHNIKGCDLQKSGLSDLARKRLIVECDTDEYQQYQLAVYILKTISQKNKNIGVKIYTILPTTACNARCVYCYEEGMATQIMTKDTADDVVDFICRTRLNDLIWIQWFGGEPLLSKDIISYICHKLNERDIYFKSKITTNASLFTKELVKEAKNIWHLQSVQVSADGKRHDYELRKRYYNPSIHNYDSMMDAISYLIDEEISVVVRCNYDSENLRDSREFLEDIKARFGNSPKLFIYFAMIFKERDKNESITLQKEVVDIIRDYQENGMKIVGFFEKDYHLRTNYCMADSEGKAVAIDPNGFLYTCEHLPGHSPFAHIRDEQISIKSDIRAYLQAHEKCRRCCFLPYCTPFLHNGCSSWDRNCYEFKRIEIDYILEQIIKKKTSFSGE